ncbi:PEGA domain-containing protein [Candidatus Woesearchaeota archaeon]|nr:MAG: WD40-domain containing protein [archaeon GW2011_AR18]MBS3162194.1 PEGA domain-containing protein [Candidatus Woesearchaeota archaeon]HIH26082.1 PEGA domain-containing protein [Nanoarchaeota archaeon]
MHKTKNKTDFLKYFLILIVLLSASFLILANDQLQTGSAIKTLDRSSLQKSTETTDTGTLKVETNPIGASVIINNMRKNTPAILNLPTGNHQLKITKTGYKESIINIEIKPGEILNVNEELTPLNLVKFSSNPTSSKLYINGNFRGNTPFNSYLDRGTYEVLIKKDGYSDYKNTIIINGAQNINAELSQLATVKIISSIQGVNVAIEKKPGVFESLGKTPLTTRLKTGDYNLRLTLGNINPSIYYYKLKVRGLSTNFNADLREYPDLKINSEPSGADVYSTVANSRERHFLGKTPLEIKDISLIAPNSINNYGIEIVKNNYLPYTKQISINEQTPIDINTNLVQITNIHVDVINNFIPRNTTVYLYAYDINTGNILSNPVYSLSSGRANWNFDYNINSNTERRYQLVVQYKKADYSDRARDARSDNYRTVSKDITLNPGQQMKIQVINGVRELVIRVI